MRRKKQDLLGASAELVSLATPLFAKEGSFCGTGCG